MIFRFLFSKIFFGITTTIAILALLQRAEVVSTADAIQTIVDAYIAFSNRAFIWLNTLPFGLNLKISSAESLMLTSFIVMIMPFYTTSAKYSSSPISGIFTSFLMVLAAIFLLSPLNVIELDRSSIGLTFIFSFFSGVGTLVTERKADKIPEAAINIFAAFGIIALLYFSNLLEILPSTAA
ncbi:hypothetical protein [Hyphococcus luteus]|nr:hypothetical protein [Marinicaulis flavus]